MNPALTQVAKYLIYGVLIYLLIMVVPNKQLKNNEILMVVVVAVGSFMLLDNLCPNKKNIEGMNNIKPSNSDTILPPVDLTLDVYSKPSMEEKDNEPEHSEESHHAEEEHTEESHHSEESHHAEEYHHAEEGHHHAEEGHHHAEEDHHHQEYHPAEIEKQEEEVDQRFEEELGCDCSDEIKKIRDMFTKEVKKIQKDLASYKRKYQKEKTRNNMAPESVEIENSEEQEIYDESSLNKAKKNEWKDALAEAQKMLGFKAKNMNKLKRIQKIKLIRKASELMIRKEIMKSLGVINVPYNHLKTATRNKVDRMTLKAMELEDSIISSVMNSGKVKKPNNKKKNKSKYNKYNPYDSNNPKNPDDDTDVPSSEEEWNDLKYSELNPKLEVPLGSYDKTFTDKWDQGWNKEGYVYLNTDKWKVPMQRPPICVTNNPSTVVPSITTGYPVNLLNWHESNNIENGAPLNIPYIRDKINVKLNPNKPVYKSG